ncbi:hypothetical protein LJC06_00365 [Bacteroidales bacterium OttesenSCG-928-I14]|nr:hypothetical protein [Bacteroidales bacterium OttesenSCG-928-I14]
MRRLNTLILCLTVFLFAVNAQNFTVIKGSGDVTPNGLSSDGKYIVGMIGDNYSPKAFSWSNEKGLTESTTMSMARAVSPSGMVVGFYENENVITENPWGAGEKARAAAYTQVGQDSWTFLPLSNEEPLQYADANSAYGISNDGTIIVGAQPSGGSVVRHFAGYWDLTNAASPKYVALPVHEIPTDPDAGLTEGSYALCVSGDGSIFGGYDVIARANGEYTAYLKRAVLWIDNQEIEIDGTPAGDTSRVLAISNNGKYAIVHYGNAKKIGIYDIENNVLEDIDVAEPPTAIGISDDGVVVAAIGRKGFMGGDSRAAIIYTKTSGVVNLTDYLEDFNLVGAEDFKFLGATAISADGNCITGYGQEVGTGAIVGFYIKLVEDPFVLIESSAGAYANGMSSDGKYVVGRIGAENYYMFSWSKEDGLKGEWDSANTDRNKKGSIAEAVSPTGRTVGTSGNPNFTTPIEVLDPETDKWVFVNLPVQTAAFNEFGEETWTFLPFETMYNRPVVYNYGAKAYGITDDGKIIVGAGNSGNSGGRPYAMYWDVSDASDIKSVILHADRGDGTGSGSLVKAVSGDGKVMGGFYNPEFAAVPVLWIDKKLTPIVGLSATGLVNGVSNNGKYAALQVREGIVDKAGFYIIESERFIMLEFENQASSALAVSDNGIVVGHWGKTASKAFVYKESRGIMPLKDLLIELGVEYPEGFDFLAATDISADGHFICGYGTLKGKTTSFRVEIPEIKEGIFPVADITVKNETYGTINLEWTAVPASSSLTGYNIYCNDELIKTVGSGETSFAHTEVKDGTYAYCITAKHGDDESLPSKPVRVTMGKKSLPYYEAFSTCQAQAPYGVPEIPLSTVFWDVSANSLAFIDSWKVGASGIPAPCAFFLSPQNGNYSESLTSPFLDASDAATLTLSFNMTVPGTSLTDKLKVEVWDGESWSMVDDIAATSNVMYGFVPKTYKVNQLAGKDNVRIRFTCYGNGATSDLNWNIDNVELSDPSTGFKYDSPLAIGAYDNQKDESVSITWADPNGYAKLKYLYTDAWTGGGIGNEGANFIAANMYPAEDLEIYKGYKLTSISFMPFQVKGVANKAEYTWFVAQDGVRLFEAPVEGAVSEVWNTIKLENPIAIDVTKDLYYGVEITSHEVNDLPIATSDIYRMDDIGNWISLDIAGGRANIYSTDDGATWEELPTFEYYDPETLYEGDVYQLFCIQATIEKDPSVGPKDRILGYRLSRNNENLIGKFFIDESTLTSLTTFIDKDPLPIGTEACYKVSVFYSSQKASEPVEVCLTRKPNAIGDLVTSTNNVLVYMSSNRVATVETSGNAIARVIDITGNILETRKFFETTEFDLNYPNGVYLISVKNDKGESSHKIVLQK